MAQKIGIENPVAECQKRVTAGDSIWLHDKETATGDLEKLIIDWQIVTESHKFGIDGKSFSGCVKNWADYCRLNLKIPADVIGDYYPATKNFFAFLKEICERNDIPQSKRENFLPREWSNVHRTPILAMVQQSERDAAKKIFNVLMANVPEEKDVQFAIDYLENQSSYFATLNDKQKIETAFRIAIIDEDYRILLDDNDEVRNELERKFRGDAYE